MQTAVSPDQISDAAKLSTLPPLRDVIARHGLAARRSLGQHFRALFGQRARYLTASERNPIKLLIHHLLRIVLFNRFTVGGIWMPVFDLAERHTWIEKLLSYQFYRGVVYYHFLMGVRKGEIADTSPVPVGGSA